MGTISLVPSQITSLATEDLYSAQTFGAFLGNELVRTSCLVRHHHPILDLIGLSYTSWVLKELALTNFQTLEQGLLRFNAWL